MIQCNGKEFFTAKELCNELQMKYSSVIHLLQKYNIPKYKNKYIVTQEQVIQIKNRENQTLKTFLLEV